MMRTTNHGRQTSHGLADAAGVAHPLSFRARRGTTTRAAAPVKKGSGPQRAPLRQPARLAVFLAVICGLLVVSLPGCTTLDVRRAFPASEAQEPAPPPPLVQSWRLDADAAFGPDAPVALADGRLVFGTRDGKVVVLDARDGKREATGDFGDAIEGRVAVSGPMVFVPLANGKTGLVGYDAVRSSRRWSLREGEHMAGPLVIGDVLVAGAHDGTVRGLGLARGEEFWRARPDSIAQIRAAPVAAAGLAVVADTEGTVRAYDPTSGDVRWTASAGAPVYRTPAVSASQVLIPTTRGRLVALSARDGRLLWSIEAGPLVRMATPAIGDGVVFAGGTDGVLRALDLQTGARLWTHTFDGTLSTSPLPAGGVVYVGTYGRRLVALDAQTGQEVWGEELKGRVKSGLVGAGGTLVVFAEPRFVYGFRPAGLASR